MASLIKNNLSLEVRHLLLFEIFKQHLGIGLSHFTLVYLLYLITCLILLALCVIQIVLLSLLRVPVDMLHISESTAAEFALDYDRHGDSYYDDTDVDGLKKSFDKIEPQVTAT